MRKSYGNLAPIGNVDEITKTFAIAEIHKVHVRIMTDQEGISIPLLVPVDTIFFAVDWRKRFPMGGKKGRYLDTVETK